MKDEKTHNRVLTLNSFWTQKFKNVKILFKNVWNYYIK